MRWKERKLFVFNEMNTAWAYDSPNIQQNEVISCHLMWKIKKNFSFFSSLIKDSLRWKYPSWFFFYWFLCTFNMHIVVVVLLLLLNLHFVNTFLMEICRGIQHIRVWDSQAEWLCLERQIRANMKFLTLTACMVAQSE